MSCQDDENILIEVCFLLNKKTIFNTYINSLFLPNENESILFTWEDEIIRAMVKFTEKRKDRYIVVLKLTDGGTNKIEAKPRLSVVPKTIKTTVKIFESMDSKEAEYKIVNGLPRIGSIVKDFNNKKVIQLFHSFHEGTYNHEIFIDLFKFDLPKLIEKKGKDDNNKSNDKMLLLNDYLSIKDLFICSDVIKGQPKYVSYNNSIIELNLTFTKNISSSDLDFIKLFYTFLILNNEPTNHAMSFNIQPLLLEVNHYNKEKISKEYLVKSIFKLVGIQYEIVFKKSIDINVTGLNNKVTVNEISGRLVSSVYHDIESDDMSVDFSEILINKRILNILKTLTQKGEPFFLHSV